MTSEKSPLIGPRSWALVVLILGCACSIPFFNPQRKPKLVFPSSENPHHNQMGLTNETQEICPVIDSQTTPFQVLKRFSTVGQLSTSGFPSTASPAHQFKASLATSSAGENDQHSSPTVTETLIVDSVIDESRFVTPLRPIDKLIQQPPATNTLTQSAGDSIPFQMQKLKSWRPNDTNNQVERRTRVSTEIPDVATEVTSWDSFEPFDSSSSVVENQKTPRWESSDSPRFWPDERFPSLDQGAIAGNAFSPADTGHLMQPEYASQSRIPSAPESRERLNQIYTGMERSKPHEGGGRLSTFSGNLQTDVPVQRNVSSAFDSRPEEVTRNRHFVYQPGLQAQLTDPPHGPP
ncbi:MAG: hypothetical protein KDB03_09090 [Planctomycetales bacterium]|nr:hypothetical protein [Planctomycetales bacterium]